ncbi:hypothetical protein CDD82_5964 [Ophiocordyceps australis]|uniref:Checkpoint protein RAD24-like helical bundle domain-containing protein n=1 Tax=Ophiocordyceps australis TaxID=1399860 RepID=A0A2C5YSG6_9HYPO|nr:hypothetical protein CDD82_5964 [Ophiocordyceps australis]
MAPQAKRRRRDRVEDSGPDQGPRNTLSNFFVSSPASPPKQRLVLGSPSKGIDASLPKTGSRNARGAADKTTADLRTLFSKQTPQATRSADDITSDPLSDDKDHVSDLEASSSSIVGQHARKRWRDGNHVASTQPLDASQRFLRPSNPDCKHKDDVDLRPWADRFGPRNLDELVVHKKKVAQVRSWLQQVVAGRSHQRLLVVKGPAGAGKTATIRLLAQDLACELVEWKNPTARAHGGAASASAQFDEFLTRGSRFGTLHLDHAAPVPEPASSGKTIVLVEEFPNTFSTSSPALAAFRASLLHHLASNAPDPLVRPVVLVMSETLLTTTSASADSLTAHRLLGSEILGHPAVAVIEYNAVAPTLLAKALHLVVLKEARASGRRRSPGPLVLKRLGEVGDIRSAISSLEFLCIKGDTQADWGSKIAFTKTRSATREPVALSNSERESLELLSQREASLGIFHAVGKVVHNKRDQEPSRLDVEKLSRFARLKPSQVNVDSLINEIGTDTHTFVSALHENYLLSCESTGPMDLSTSIDYANESIDFLSASDLLCPWRDVFSGGRAASSTLTSADCASHVLRQDEIMFHVAVRGLLFSLPHPVRRKPRPGKPGHPDAFAIFYPCSLKLWRAKEEIDGLVQLVSAKLLRGETQLPTKKLTDGANVFRRKPRPAASCAPLDPPSMLSLASAARQELLLDRLPYMAHIARARKSAAWLSQIDKIVCVTTPGPPASDDNDADELLAAAQNADAILSNSWATDGPLDSIIPRKAPNSSSILKPSAMPGLLQQKLVLSDDDIED